MAESKAVGVEYIDANKGLTVREFSLEVHGEDYLDTAKQFAKKHDGRVLKNGEVVEVEEQQNPNEPVAPATAPKAKPAAKKATAPKAAK